MLGQPPTRAISLLPDLTLRETAVLAPLAVLILVIGIFPGPLMRTMECSVAGIVEQMRPAGIQAERADATKERRCVAAAAAVNGPDRN
jgi:NADH:ubiquinone oxidoreductase subunit 4 (subunit M)